MGRMWRIEMRISTAIMAIVLMTMPAHAQMGMGGKKGHQETQKQQDTTVKADETAYKEALKSIPTPKEKPDPWKDMR
jgi:hypothetical protein